MPRRDCCPLRVGILERPGCAKDDGEGEILCLGKTEGGREEIRGSEEEDKTYEEVQGGSETTRRCEG